MGVQVSNSKRVSFYIMMVLISLLIVEAGFRVVLAFQVGPRILFYGTPFHWKKVPAAALPARP